MRNWGQAIPRCGADLIGYFAPQRARRRPPTAFYEVADLAAYEAYRARLRDDPGGRANHEFARRERFNLKEDRMFLHLASAPRAIAPAQPPVRS